VRLAAPRCLVCRCARFSRARARGVRVAVKHGLTDTPAPLPLALLLPPPLFPLLLPHPHLPLHCVPSRHEVADERERIYTEAGDEAAGGGCYMFRIDENAIVDATWRVRTVFSCSLVLARSAHATAPAHALYSQLLTVHHTLPRRVARSPPLCFHCCIPVLGIRTPASTLLLCCFNIASIRHRATRRAL
jgi:hypothetical protein